MQFAVIIPTFNRSSLVCQAVESALGQAGEPKVIVIDDGSEDDTCRKLEGFGSDIRVISQENKERGAARNRGFEQVGEVDAVTFLDADDIMLEGHLRQLTDLAAEHPSASLWATRAFLSELGSRPYARLGNTTPGPISLRSFLLGKHALPPSTFALRSDSFERVGGFEERRDLAGSEDWLFVTRVLSLGEGYRGKEVTVSFRRHPGNTMADPDRMVRTMLLAHDLFFGGGDRRSAVGSTFETLRTLSRPSRAVLLVNASAGFYSTGRMREARENLKKAVEDDPFIITRAKPYWIFARSLMGARLSKSLRGVVNDLRGLLLKIQLKG